MSNSIRLLIDHVAKEVQGRAPQVHIIFLSKILPQLTAEHVYRSDGKLFHRETGHLVSEREFAGDDEVLISEEFMSRRGPRWPFERPPNS